MRFFLNYGGLYELQSVKKKSFTRADRRLFLTFSQLIFDLYLDSNVFKDLKYFLWRCEFLLGTSVFRRDSSDANANAIISILIFRYRLFSVEQQEQLSPMQIPSNRLYFLSPSFPPYFHFLNNYSIPYKSFRFSPGESRKHSDRGE